MFRDKDYLLTTDDLTFTVLGDQHAPGLVTAGLKYVRGEKWLKDYAAAVRFLEEHYPHYTTGPIVQVPVEAIQEHLKPQPRAAALRESPPKPGSLLTLAVELMAVLARVTEIPPNSIGITDSLLWGEGNPTSDIDLVIYGREHVSRFLGRAEELFQLSEFAPIVAEHIQRPPDLDDATFATIVARKHNQGFFHGTRFTVRGVLDDDEILKARQRIAPYYQREPLERELEITGTAESLLYPIAYDCHDAPQIVCFHIGYEMALRPGDRVQVKGMLESGKPGVRIVVGSFQGQEEYIRLQPANDTPHPP